MFHGETSIKRVKVIVVDPEVKGDFESSLVIDWFNCYHKYVCLNLEIPCLIEGLREKEKENAYKSLSS